MTEALDVEWFDSHCHVPYDGIDADVIAAARAAGVTRMVTIGTNAAESRTAIEVARANEGVWATVGLHPHDATDGLDSLVDVLASAAGDPAVVGIGECGLDFHYDHSPREVQRESFAAQIALAHEHDLALVIHTREAWDDTFAIVQDAGVPSRTVLHCFTGGPAEAERALELGMSISFSGIITFPKAPEVRDAAAMCPLDRVLVETDAPFLAPVPNRGKRNEPSYLPFVGAAVAQAMGRSVEEVAAATSANAAKLFGLSVALA